MVSSSEVVDAEGWAQTTGLHQPGFTTLLWKTLQPFGYTEPPKYMWQESSEHGLSCCNVLLSIPANEEHPEWMPFTVRAKGLNLNQALEFAAHQALTQFCEDHKEELEGHAAALFPIRDQSDRVWRKRIRAVCNPHMPGHNPVLAAVVTYASFLSNLCYKQSMMAEFHLEHLKEVYERLQANNGRIAELTQQMQAKRQLIGKLKQQLDHANQRG